MKNLPIDTVLLAIEQRADLLGKEIDRDARYVFICETVADFEFRGTTEYENKERSYFYLQSLCQDYNLDFRAIMTKILLGE